MKAEVFASILLLAAPAYAQRGLVSEVRTATPAGGEPVAIRVTGANPCGAVRIDYGDGAVITHAITGVPVTLTHVYERPGTYRVTAEGMGNCDGRAETTARWSASPPPPPEAAVQPDPPDARSGEIVDRATESDWTETRFHEIDRNRDGRIGRGEWRVDPEQFRRVDANHDGWLSLSEFLGESPSADRFTELDANRDGVISPREWRGPRRQFDTLDTNRDGVVTRPEFDSSQERSGAVSRMLDDDSTKD